MKRRSFLKAALTVIATASVASPVLDAALGYISTEHPEVTAVLNRLPGLDLEQRRDQEINNHLRNLGHIV